MQMVYATGRPRRFEFAVGCETRRISGRSARVVHAPFPFGFARAASRTASAFHEQFNRGASRPAMPSPPTH